MKKIKKNTVFENSAKYGSMSFNDFWNQYCDEVNAQMLLEYNKSSKFMKVFLSKKNDLLDKSYMKSIAKYFFENGRLQMVSSINLERYNNEKTEKTTNS